MKREKIIEVMDTLGYQVYNENGQQYFLPIKKKMKFHTKLPFEKVESLFMDKGEKSITKKLALRKVHK